MSNRPIIDYDYDYDTTPSTPKKAPVKEIKEEEPKKKTKKEPKPKPVKDPNKKSKGPLIFIFVLIVLVVGVSGFFIVSELSKRGNEVDESKPSTITTETPSKGKDKFYATTSKLNEPTTDPTMMSLSTATDNINTINNSIVKYFTEIKETVVAFMNKKTSAYELESDLMKYKENIENDKIILAKYRTMYEAYGGEYLYADEMKRLDNELELVNAISSTMTNEALVATFNTYVEYETALNNKTVNDLKNYLDVNSIQYTEQNGYITYVLE